MMEKFLKSLGVNSYDELTPEERETYHKLSNVLSGRKLTDEDVQTFLKGEITDATQKLIGRSLQEREDTFLKMKIELLMAILRFLDSPRIEKEYLERNLIN